MVPRLILLAVLHPLLAGQAKDVTSRNDLLFLMYVSYSIDSGFQHHVSSSLIVTPSHSAIAQLLICLYLVSQWDFGVL